MIKVTWRCVLFQFTNEIAAKTQIFKHTPVWGDIQPCDISLDEGDVAVMTIVLPVFLHKAFHEVHSGHMVGLSQQVAGVSAADTQQHYIHLRRLIKCSSTHFS